MLNETISYGATLSSSPGLIYTQDSGHNNSYLGGLSPVVVFLLRLFRPLLVEKGFVGFRQLYSLLATDGQGVVRLVPLAERRRIDGDDGVLDERLGSDQLVIAGVVNGVDDTRLSSDGL